MLPVAHFYKLGFCEWASKGRWATGSSRPRTHHLHWEAQSHGPLILFLSSLLYGGRHLLFFCRTCNNYKHPLPSPPYGHILEPWEMDAIGFHPRSRQASWCHPLPGTPLPHTNLKQRAPEACSSSTPALIGGLSFLYFLTFTRHLMMLRNCWLL